MEDPVEKVSERVTNLNSLEHQLMISSQIRVICIIRILEFDKNSRIKSRSETASRELLYGFAKPIKSDVILRSIGKVVPAKAAAPSGGNIGMLDIKFKTFSITCEHIVVSHQVVTKRNTAEHAVSGCTRGIIV